MRAPMTDAPRRWLWVVAGAAIVVAALAAGTGPLITSTKAPPIRLRVPPNLGRNGSQPSPPPRRSLAPPPHHAASSSGAWHVLSVLITVLAFLALATAAGFAIRALLRRYDDWRKDRNLADDATATVSLPADAETAARVAAAIAQALGALDDETDPRRAVISCWLRFEAALRDRGMTRDVAETSTELSGRAAEEYPVDPDLLRRLNELFRAARYSSAPVSPDAPAAARVVLEEIRRRLAAVPESVG
jgi:Domain of unknown function (DUF4129)